MARMVMVALAVSTSERQAARQFGAPAPAAQLLLYPSLDLGWELPSHRELADAYRAEAESHRLVGSRTRHVFQLATAVQVELLGADLRRRSLDLKLLGAPGVGPGSTKRRGHPAERQRRSRG